jgi:choline dehydrogenase-like flavoprotein
VYYEPKAAQPNIVLLANSIATKINLTPASKSGETYKAASVSYSSGGKTYTVALNKEVIVAGGAVNTPQILELSGIGNPDILKKAGVTPLINLPGVGENSQVCVHLLAMLSIVGLNEGYDRIILLFTPSCN